MATTDSATRGEDNERENRSRDQGMIRNRRIPPPPPLPRDELLPSGGGPVHPFVLKVRCLTRSGALTTVRIQIYPNMSDESLGRCISQAVASYNSVPPEQIVGLFGEHDSVFYSLQHILGNPESGQFVFSVHRPIIKEEKQDDSWLKILEYVLLAAALVVSLFFYGEDAMKYVVQKAVDVFYLLFDLPIRELYRHGPYLIGWESMDMPDICSRITYHGDREFWSRNRAECQAIFNSKEEAFVRVCRPAMYLVLVMVLFAAIRHLVAVYAENKRDRTDRAVLETYHAFQTMIRLITRQVDRQYGRSRH